jgi:dolichol-phosphate mannosyltransferase
MRTLVLLPTYNEAGNISEVLRKLRQAVPLADLLVIDDGSPDGTADIAEAEGRALGQIEVLRRPGKSGLGSAYRRGFEIALERGYDAAVQMDSDLSHDPAALPSLLAAAEAGADLVIGSRYVPGGRIENWKLRRRVLSRGGNLYATVLLGIGVKDATTGYRVYRASTLRALDFSLIQADGFGFLIQLAYRVRQLGLRIVEVPITFTDRVSGTSKMSGAIFYEALWDVFVMAVRERLLRRPPAPRRPDPAATPAGRL